MDDAQVTINFGGPNPNQGLDEFMSWFLDNGGIQSFIEHLENNNLILEDGDWTDDSIHLEISEVQDEDSEDENEDL